ncbi:hypothetical protein [Methylomagnum sp.]
MSNVEKYLGSNSDDRIKGGDKGVILFDNGGSDAMFGGKGNDTFYAGSGDDFYFGNGGKDTFIFEGDFAHDSVANYTKGNSFTIDGHNLSNFIFKMPISSFGIPSQVYSDGFFMIATDYHSVQFIDPNGNSVFLEHAIDNHVIKIVGVPGGIAGGIV